MRADTLPWALNLKEKLARLWLVFNEVELKEERSLDAKDGKDMTYGVVCGRNGTDLLDCVSLLKDLVFKYLVFDRIHGFW